MENRMVSVIIPVYNVERYLNRCVDSVLNQTYQNLEIILVDDGSPDRCGAICDEYSKRDNRITVIHKKNGGLSDARNAGLDIATGEYLYFVDSDDWIAESAIEQLIAVFNKDDAIDIVAGCSVDVHERDGTLFETRYSITPGSKKVLSKAEAIKDNLLHGWAAWNKLYKLRLFADVRFPVGVINEDEAILLHVLDKIRKVAQIGIPTYYYFLRENSITTSKFSEKKMDWFTNCVSNCEFIKMNYPELYPEAQYRLTSCMIYLMQFMLLEYKRFDNQIKTIMSKLKSEYDTIVANTYLSNLEKHKIRLFKWVVTCKCEWMYSLAYRIYRLK